jgi:hypothetical protein
MIKAEVFMTQEQEIRAKALEIAALILGERVDTKLDGGNLYTTRLRVLDYDSTLIHYIPLAQDVARYIREGSEG